LYNSKSNSQKSLCNFNPSKQIVGTSQNGIVWHSCNFYNILTRSGIILRMVYMDSDCDGFCIRNAIGGARDEVWQDATL